MLTVADSNKNSQLIFSSWRVHSDSCTVQIWKLKMSMVGNVSKGSSGGGCQTGTSSRDHHRRTSTIETINDNKSSSWQEHCGALLNFQQLNIPLELENRGKQIFCTFQGREAGVIQGHKLVLAVSLVLKTAQKIVFKRWGSLSVLPLLLGGKNLKLINFHTP